MLNEHFQSVTFGSVVNCVNSTERNPRALGIEKIVGLEHIDPNDIHIRRWDRIENGTSFTRKFLPGQTLFGKRRAYQRKVAYAEFSGICSGDILTFESRNQSVLLPKLLPYICMSDAFYEFAVGTSAGSLSPRTSWGALRDFQFLLPPIEEQKRIVSILAAADEVIEKWRTASECLLQTARAFRSKTSYDLASFRKPISDVCTLKGGSGFKPVFQGKKTGEFPFIKVSDMNSLGNEKYIGVAENYVDKHEVKCMKAVIMPSHSVVFAKVGAALLLNRRRILTTPSCIDNNMMAAIPNENRLLPEFLYLTMIDIDFKNLVQDGALPSVNNTIVGSIEIPVPSVDKQKEIVDKHNIIIRNLSMTQSHIHKTRNMLQAIIRDNIGGN